MVHNVRPFWRRHLTEGGTKEEVSLASQDGSCGHRHEGPFSIRFAINVASVVKDPLRLRQLSRGGHHIKAFRWKPPWVQPSVGSLHLGLGSSSPSVASLKFPLLSRRPQCSVELAYISIESKSRGKGGGRQRCYKATQQRVSTTRRGLNVLIVKLTV